MKNENLRPLDSIEDAILDLKSGKMIIVVDDEDRENEGDFVMAADMVTPEAVNFMATVGRGLICTPLSTELARKFDLPLQVQTNTASLGTAFTVTIDAKEKISTGISASDRAYTIKLLSDPLTVASDFARPGHIFPLIAKDGGVLERPGHTEASVDLSKLSGFSPVSVICEIMNSDGSMARFPELCKLADQHQLKMIAITDLITYRRTHENLISTVESIPFPTKFGEFYMYIFRSEILGQEHVAIVKGDLLELKSMPLVRIHSECFTGDVFGSSRCDCGAQLETSLKLISVSGSGALIYLKQEGRGIGLFNKIKAYQLQDSGMDTAEANLHLGFPVDSRDYTMASQILRYFGVTSMKLLTNNPKKIEGLAKLGFRDIHREPLEIDANLKNGPYLFTKKNKMGHLLKQTLLNQ
ncbi:MAG TPA: bifunctional 3,4-dihydroxy-2-butanone-4-phosphate synthase/GTP cyclohydrolase II [Bacteriovoracaceae bacterium]|nr:bifunctional 3,4-dihydroxy-2-butanone-4-phosphate synthase/GTP cyclohydrolase II [Bacteriovoracaceae bacterium]